MCNRFHLKKGYPFPNVKIHFTFELVVTCCWLFELLAMGYQLYCM